MKLFIPQFKSKLQTVSSRNVQIHNMTIASEEIKTMVFMDTSSVKTKILINNESVEQVVHFKYLGCNITYDYSKDAEKK